MKQKICGLRCLVAKMLLLLAQCMSIVALLNIVKTQHYSYQVFPRKVDSIDCAWRFGFCQSYGSPQLNLVINMIWAWFYTSCLQVIGTFWKVCICTIVCLYINHSLVEHFMISDRSDLLEPTQCNANMYAVRECAVNDKEIMEIS